jgi:flagellar hook assembly protein FlgD
MAQVAVYDVAGRCVRRLIDTRLSAGRHVIQWDGLDDTGSGLASGVYFYELRVDGRVAARERAILRR